MNYSQHAEQDAILEAVKDMPTGRFLDIGAYDGETFSNTMCLSERGWSGVCVEPGLAAFAALCATYEKNPQITLIHALIGLTNRNLVEFWDCGSFYSSTEPENVQRWTREVNAHFTRYMVPQLGISDLLLKFEPFDVVSIDTEGTSVAILTAMLGQSRLQSLLDRARPEPRVICVEHDGQNLTATASYYGYSITYRSPVNVVMVRG
jgi:FkbM family methyltransferase